MKAADDRSGWPGLHGVAIVGLIFAANSFPVLRIWPLLWVAPLAAYALLVALVPPLRATFRPWRFGQLTARGAVATLVLAAGSSAVLLLFQSRVQPDLGAFGAFPNFAWAGGVFVFGILFSVFNALFEEIIFRGILFDAAESQWGVWGAVGITAVLFGLGHARGYPPGPIGVLLAVVFGFCMGWLRLYTRGLGLPVLAHIAADATIFSIAVRAGALLERLSTA